MSSTKHTVNIFTWFFLFFGALALLPVMFYENGNRINIPHNQYYFFAIILLAWLCYAVNFRFKNVASTLKDSWFICIFLLFIACFISALAGLTPFYGVRLLVIVALTSLPFLIAGRLSVNHPFYSALPFLLYGLLVVGGTFWTNYVGPVKVGTLVFNNFLWNNYPGERWSFWFREANGLSIIMALMVSSGLYFLLQSKTLCYRILTLVFLAGTLYILYQSGSRAAMLWAWSSIWFLITVFSIRKFNSPFKVPLLLFLFIIITSAGFHALKYGNRHEAMNVPIHLLKSHTVSATNYNFAQSANTFTSGRAAVWTRSITQLKSNPFFGYGYGAEEQFLNHQAHLITGNVYIRLASESGIFSFILFVILLCSGMYVSAKSCFKNWDNNQSLANYAFFICACLIGIALDQLGDAFILRIEEINYLFFFFIGAAWSLRLQHE